MGMKKYFLHYSTQPVFWLNARSIGGVLRQLRAKGMDVPDCIEDCHGEIWWKEDN
jgi:hypothetical protein